MSNLLLPFHRSESQFFRQQELAGCQGEDHEFELEQERGPGRGQRIRFLRNGTFFFVKI